MLLDIRFIGWLSFVLVDDGRLALASGFEVIRPSGCVEDDTGFLLELLVRLKGVEVIRLLVVELATDCEVVEELELIESSPRGLLSEALVF